MHNNINSWSEDDTLHYGKENKVFEHYPWMQKYFETIYHEKREKIAPQLLPVVQHLCEPALEGNVIGFMTGVHGPDGIINFYDESPNIIYRLTPVIEGMMYDENGLIKETLTEQEQRDLNTLYKEVLCYKFHTLPEQLSHELHQLADRGYLEFEDCAHIEYRKKSRAHHKAIQKKLNALEARYAPLVEKGRNNPVNQHFFKMFHIPAKEDALAYGEKHNVFQTYPWLRYKIDPSLKQKKIVTQHLKQECTPALDVTQKYHQQLQNNQNVSPEAKHYVQIREQALQKAQNTQQFQALQGTFEQECDAGLDLTQDRIQSIPFHELGLVHSNQKMLIKIARDLAKGERFAQASLTLNTFWKNFTIADAVGPEIYTTKADKVFTQELDKQMQQPLVITATPLHKEILTGLKEVFITRPIWVVKGFAHRTQEIVETGVDVSIDALCGGDRWYVGIKQIAKQSAHFIDHYLLSDLTRKLNLYQVRKFNEGIKQGNMSPEFSELEKYIQKAYQDMGYQDSFEYEKELSELVETLQADGNIVELIGRFFDQTTATDMCEYLSSQEGCEKIGALLADVGLGKVAGLAIEGAAGAAGTVLSEFSQPGISVVATEGAPLIIVADGVATETIAETIRKVAEATRKAAEVGVPGGNAASQLAMFKKGKNSGGSSKPKTIPNKKFDGITRKWGDKQVPDDYQTILKNDPSFQKINYSKKGATIYVKDKIYYYRDTAHEGIGAHLEVFDKTGKKHLGKANPLTGELIPGTADPSKKPIF